MGDTVIKAEGVAKKFCKRLRHSMYHGTMDVARGMLGMESKTELLRKGEFWAVEDVSFELKRGETLGLIGPNGSGKSTLLRMLNGIYPPDRGRIEIRGRVGALIAVGAGFHPLMSGRENIYLNGAIMGMGKKEIDRKFDSIVDFADIEDFLDAPVKTYSSGMYVRLGFAVAIHSEPDILLVDEVLAVGDAKYQQKCYGRMKSFQESGKTIVLVAHDMNAVMKHCGSALLLDRGGVVAHGTVKEVVNTYYSLLWGRGDGPEGTDEAVPAPAMPAAEQSFPGPAEDLCSQNLSYNPGEARFGNGRAAITDFRILDDEGREIRRLRSGQYMRFRVRYLFKDEVVEPVYGFSIKTKDGMVVYGNNTLNLRMDFRARKSGDYQVVEFLTRMPLAAGDYFLSANVVDTSQEAEEVLDRRYDLAHIEVGPTESFWAGPVDLLSSISLIDRMA